jgi:hypothetical protein
MPSNSEMYDLGAQDAERDDLNPFYYQHYYYYRKGYDEARRQLRRGPIPGTAPRRIPLIIGVVSGLLVVASVLWLLLGQAQADVATPLADPTAPIQLPTSAPTARPTTVPAISIEATPTPEGLQIGGQAQVTNLNGAPLRARQAPGLSAAIVARIPEGSTVTLLDGPVEADGYVWWQVTSGNNTGWSAERSPEGVIFLEPLE